MRPRRLILASFALILLAGCQSMTPEERRAANERTCLGYGFRPRTDAMAQCLLDLDLDRRAQIRSLQESNDRLFWRQPLIVERRVFVHRP
jgi:hypothetical protein